MSFSFKSNKYKPTFWHFISLVCQWIVAVHAFVYTPIGQSALAFRAEITATSSRSDVVLVIISQAFQGISVIDIALTFCVCRLICQTCKFVRNIIGK